MTKEQFLGLALVTEYPEERRKEIFGEKYDPNKVYIGFSNNKIALGRTKEIRSRTGITPEDIIAGRYGAEKHVAVYSGFDNDQTER